MSETNQQYIKMTETPIPKLIIGLSIPTIISMMVTSIYNMADTYFVGTLGTSASGATGVVFGLMGIIQAFGFMYGHGAGSNISRKLGEKNLEEAREYASTSFFLSILTGIIIAVISMLSMDSFMRLLGSTETILPYARIYAFFILLAAPAMTSSCVMNNILRYEGKAFFAMIGLTAGGILNIFGDFLFVKVLQMGIAGAGLSTTISQYFSMVLLLIPYLQNKTQSKFSLSYFTKRLEVIRNIISVGMPSLARQGLNSVSTMFLNHFAGIYGDGAVAAISIVQKIIGFLFCITIGIGQGLQPVSSFNYGAKKYKRVKEALIFTMQLGLGLMLLLGIFGYLNAPFLVSIFRDDPEVIEIGSTILRWQSISLVFMGFAMYGNMLFQSIGYGAIATLLATMRSGIILIPVLITFVNLFGLTGLQMAQAVAEVVSAMVTLPFMISFFKKLPKQDLND